MHATFVNTLGGAPAKIFWVHSDTGEEIPVTEPIEGGASVSLNSHPGHQFVAKHAETGEVHAKFEITAEPGATQQFHIGTEL